MPQLETFTEQQSRIDRAFVVMSTCRTAFCERCSRTYFVTSPGHGDYENDELDRLRRLSETKPDEYIEVPDFGSVSTMHLNGKDVVVGCLCDPTKFLSEFIEDHADQLTAYLRDYWEHVRTEAVEQKEKADAAIVALAEVSKQSEPREETNANS